MEKIKQGNILGNIPFGSITFSWARSIPKKQGSMDQTVRRHAMQDATQLPHGLNFCHVSTNRSNGSRRVVPLPCHGGGPPDSMRASALAHRRSNGGHQGAPHTTSHPCTPTPRTGGQRCDGASSPDFMVHDGAQRENPTTQLNRKLMLPTRCSGLCKPNGPSPDHKQRSETRRRREPRRWKGKQGESAGITLRSPRISVHEQQGEGMKLLNLHTSPRKL